MGKAHRDNHQARLKAVERGVDAFGKKAERRKEPAREKCNACGTPSRVLTAGLCKMCFEGRR